MTTVSALAPLTEDVHEVVPCPMCGERGQDLLFEACDRLFARPGTYGIVRCQSCELRYLSPRPTLASLGLHYPDEYFIYQKVEDVHPLMRPAARAINQLRWGAYVRRFERVIGRFQPETRIVDVGCGLNEHLATLRRMRGCEGVGVDFKPEVVAYVRDALRMPIRQGTLHDAGFADGEFDVVTMNEYLEHEPNPSQVLREARRITKPGGYLAIEVPLINSVPARMFGARWSQIDAPRHLVYFTKDTLDQMLRRTGYKLIHTQTFHIPLLIGMSVLQAFGHRRLGRMSALDSALVTLASLPFILLLPLMDEFLFAVARAE